jgi:hypothetical protein
MIRRKAISIITAVCLWAAVLPVAVTTTGCVPQNTLAALVTTLGNSAASIASLEGNSALATKLQADTAAAASAVANWKSGTPAQIAIEAIQLVEDDLNLFPIGGQYEPLIVLALGTALSIIQLLNPNAVSAHLEPQNGRRVQLAQAPKTAKAYAQQWNAIRSSNSSMSAAPVL